MLYKTQGIIVKKVNSGEFDRLLTVYTKDFGKILLKAKSVRKNQSKLKGHLELFLYSHLMIAPAKGFDIITGAETIESFPFLHRNLSSLASAYYLAELTDKLFVGPEKDERIWQLILFNFRDLNKKKQNSKTLINNFENKLVELLGYGNKQKDATFFIEPFLDGKINSRYFLQKVAYLLE